MRTLRALLLLLLISTHAWAQAPPTLVWSAPPELAAARSRAASFDPRPLAGIVRTVGLDAPGPPIDVVLAGEDSEAARSMRPWVAGYAISNAGLIVLFPARSPGYPHDTLEDVLRHEVAHVLIARAAGGRPVPRWFHEGLAVAVEPPWDLADRSRLVWELVAGPRLTLREIDALFDAGATAQSRAYSLAAAVVRDFIRAHGPAAPAGVLRFVREGDAFSDAVARVAGRPLGAVEDDFWDRQRVWTIWVPFVTSGDVLWLLVIGVAALAVWRRRRQSREIRRRWDEEAAESARSASHDV
jgi:MYXO-CTERM domain-containing protein